MVTYAPQSITSNTGPAVTVLDNQLSRRSTRGDLDVGLYVLVDRAQHTRVCQCDFSRLRADRFPRLRSSGCDCMEPVARQPLRYVGLRSVRAVNASKCLPVLVSWRPVDFRENPLMERPLPSMVGFITDRGVAQPVTFPVVSPRLFQFHPVRNYDERPATFSGTVSSTCQAITRYAINRTSLKIRCDAMIY